MTTNQVNYMQAIEARRANRANELIKSRDVGSQVALRDAQASYQKAQEKYILPNTIIKGVDATSNLIGNIGKLIASAHTGGASGALSKTNSGIEESYYFGPDLSSDPASGIGGGLRSGLQIIGG